MSAAITEPLNLSQLLDRGEAEATQASHSLTVLDVIIEAIGGSLGPEVDDYRMGESDFGRDLRRFERLRQRRQALAGKFAASPDTEGRLTVEELAHTLGQTPGATRRLLELGLIPGARRKTPNTKNSPWIIPASAPSEYLAANGGKKEN